MILSVIDDETGHEIIELPLSPHHIGIVIRIQEEDCRRMQRVGFDFTQFTILFKPEELNGFSMERALNAGFKGKMLVEIRGSWEDHLELLRLVHEETIKTNATLVGEITAIASELKTETSEIKRRFRSARLSELLKEFYGHQCMICYGFILTDGTPHTETHHVIPLSEGGDDSSENIAVVCPNCHARFHYGSTGCRIRMSDLFFQRNPFIQSTNNHNSYINQQICGGE